VQPLAAATKGVEEDDMDFPEELKYTPQHQWVRVEGDGSATIGITDFAQEELGEIVYVDHPAVGDSIEKDASFGEVESNKTSSDVYAPCSGQILEVNSVLDEDPGRLNSDPYGDGWMIKIRPLEPGQFQGLLSSSGYRTLVEG